MSSRGWAGDPPVSDDEALRRILDAADEIAHEAGRPPRVAEVARSLGIARQTVHRHLGNAHSMVEALCTRSTDAFLAELVEHQRGRTDPIATIVDAAVLAISAGLRDRNLAAVVNSSESGQSFGRALVQCSDVDWASRGWTREEVDEMAEMCLRTVRSFILDQGRVPTDAGIRATVMRWLGPAIAFHESPPLAESSGKNTSAG